jgi:hypothetical protein
MFAPVDGGVATGLFSTVKVTISGCDFDRASVLVGSFVSCCLAEAVGFNPPCWVGAITGFWTIVGVPVDGIPLVISG